VERTQTGASSNTATTAYLHVRGEDPRIGELARRMAVDLHVHGAAGGKQQIDPRLRQTSTPVKVKKF